jgi:hypothetical protein
MKKTISTLSLVIFGAILATGVNMYFYLWPDAPPLSEVETARNHLLAETRQPLANSFIQAPAMNGWRVDVYAQEGLQSQDWTTEAAFVDWKPSARDQTTKLLGRFMHTGSWVDMAEYRKHSGIFVATPVSISIRGYLFAEFDDDYVFAVHFNNRATNRASAENFKSERTTWIRCKVSLKLNDAKVAIQDIARFDSHTSKAELRSMQPVALSGGGWHLIENSVSCILPRTIDAADISFRICMRRRSEGGFSPVQPVMPLAKPERAPPFNVVNTTILSQ